jgi:hypothetical protein
MLGKLVNWPPVGHCVIYPDWIWMKNYQKLKHPERQQSKFDTNNAIFFHANIRNLLDQPRMYCSNFGKGSVRHKHGLGASLRSDIKYVSLSRV